MNLEIVKDRDGDIWAIYRDRACMLVERDGTPAYGVMPGGADFVRGAWRPLITLATVEVDE